MEDKICPACDSIGISVSLDLLGCPHCGDLDEYEDMLNEQEAYTEYEDWELYS